VTTGANDAMTVSSALSATAQECWVPKQPLPVQPVKCVFAAWVSVSTIVEPNINGASQPPTPLAQLIPVGDEMTEPEPPTMTTVNRASGTPSPVTLRVQAAMDAAATRRQNMDRATAIA